MINISNAHGKKVAELLRKFSETPARGTREVNDRRIAKNIALRFEKLLKHSKHI